MSIDMNTVFLVGNLTRDIELKYTNSGYPIGNMSIASNKRIKNGENWEDKANFFDLKLYGKRAESLQQYLTKGKKIALEGELDQERWETDGQKRSKVIVIVNRLQLLGGAENTKTISANEADNKNFEDDVPF